jgi:hypothetical protein
VFAFFWQAPFRQQPVPQVAAPHNWVSQSPWPSQNSPGLQVLQDSPSLPHVVTLGLS